MRKSRFNESQIVGILKEADGGIPVADLLRKHGVSKTTFFKWRSKYGAPRFRTSGGCGSSRRRTPSSSGCTRTWRSRTRPSRMF